MFERVLPLASVNKIDWVTSCERSGLTESKRGNYLEAT
jgi:hypothetical protein